MNQPCIAECVQPTLSLGKTRPKIGLGCTSDWLKKQKNKEEGFLNQSRRKEMRDLRSREIIFEANLKTTLNFFCISTDYQDD